MHISNVRLGFATNSSSSHSLILVSPDEYAQLQTTEYTQFGWDYFVAADTRSKRNYLAAITRDAIRRRMGYEVMDSDVGSKVLEVLVQELFPDDPEIVEEISDGYVDHQSCFGLPSTWDENGLDREFFNTFRDWLVQQPIAILGGNDNGGDEHPLNGLGTLVDLPFEKDQVSVGSVVRNDDTHWVLFNRDTGAKFRFTFDGSAARKAKTPELVDVKITGFCTFGCSYCYQASTPAGEHAPLDRIRSIADMLAELRVFEVAIGGGEPTLHPDFLTILEIFRSRKIVPNFTTRNVAWLKDTAKRAQIQGLIGSFGFSVETPADVKRLREALGEINYNVDAPKATVQYVVGCGGDLKGVLETAQVEHLNVLLLGFKHTGFGKDFSPVDENWINVVDKHRGKRHWYRIGADTALVQQYHDQLVNRLNVSEALMTTEEGKFSMYIDAVTGRIAPSSYCDEADYRPLGTKEELLEAFRTW